MGMSQIEIQKINRINHLYAVKADGTETYLLQNEYFVIPLTCHENTSIWCCYNSTRAWQMSDTFACEATV